jgi:hypothetical protein
MTVARMPNMPYPGFPNNAHINGSNWTNYAWSIMPPPPDTSLPLGYNPGGLRSGEMGEPLGPVKLMLDPQEIAQQALVDNVATTSKIQELMHRVENASEVHYKAMTATKYDVPDIIPPMVASMGPDGVHTDSPYGPWEVKPPYSGSYDKTAGPDEIVVSDEVVAKAGGFDHLQDNLLATPYPPSNFLQAFPSPALLDQLHKHLQVHPMK